MSVFSAFKSKKITILLNLSLSAAANGNVNSSHPLVTDVVKNCSVLLSGFPISSSLILTSVFANADHTFIFKPAFALKSSFASKSIWLLSQGLFPSLVILPTLQEAFTALSESGLSIHSKSPPSSIIFAV